MGRLWGLLGIYFAAKRLVLKSCAKKQAEGSEKAVEAQDAERPSSTRSWPTRRSSPHRLPGLRERGLPVQQKGATLFAQDTGPPGVHQRALLGCLRRHGAGQAPGRALAQDQQRRRGQGPQVGVVVDDRLYAQPGLGAADGALEHGEGPAAGPGRVAAGGVPVHRRHEGPLARDGLRGNDSLEGGPHWRWGESRGMRREDIKTLGRLGSRIHLPFVFDPGVCLEAIRKGHCPTCGW
ncbi:hypothetical protein ACCO45_004371 [Purpureocillium lilacinum]|uniref:Uncharacterized protein n=1 Tax=Purpureocillium lilacinum TaxID=33203 RepID=A0ACC4E3D8_PURLI